MRLSIVMGDPGYLENINHFKILPDGVPIPNVLTADEELGFLIKSRTEKDGSPMFNKVTGCLKYQKFDGVIKIIDTRRK